MSEKPQDPAGTTHQFQNFAAQRPAEKSKQVNTGLIVGAVLVVALVVVVAIAVAMMM
ncbi:hypothetical protein [Actinomadura rugatobispora]|uniref:Uncharacterized protein n=1 Tax=Actinomadura rugatobispora TaxID=1994 RepID=A0ABW1A720_9ACTN|nr:hypothetical protein GCM10010200_041540 [Actinomadura rugatobispora]